MLKRFITLLFVSFNGIVNSQLPGTGIEYEAQAIGGKEQVEQVLQTQLTLPKAILTSNFEKDVSVFFDIDSAGNAINMEMTAGLNNLLRNEIKRIFKFLKFKKTQSSNQRPEPYWVTLKLSTEKYNNYFKQRSKINLKKGIAADSSYVIRTRGDKSPEYYKGGDEGLAEYILSEIEYPKLAVEKSIEGTVILEFVVETNGYVTSIVTKQGVNGGCTDEAIRLIKRTKWQPATLNNKFVRYQTTYPITFSLRNVSKDGSGAMGQ